MLIVTVRPAKAVEDKELKRFYSFLYIALALAGFLMIMILVENMVKNFPQSGYQIVAALAILFLTFNIVVVVNAEMDNMVNMKLQIFSSQSTNGSQNPVHVDVREDEVKIKNYEKPKTEINLAKFINDPDASQEGKSSEQPKSLRSRLIKIFKSPTIGEDYTIPQALVNADMIIVVVATTCGVGTGRWNHSHCY
ncbi:hypothetical protein SUGI_0481610 [Cryptomeria japonica]|nr:hypothetical protein SUGI_0481610 [Cryptomeria japonica]